MRFIEMGTMALAAAFISEASARPTLKRQPNEGWPGQDVASVVNSPIFKRYNYTTSPDKLPPELKGKLPVDKRASIFPQDNGTIHFAPNLDCLQPLLTDPNAKIDANCSLSSIVLSLDGNSTTVAEAQFWVHPKGEEKFVKGDPKEHLNPEVDQFIKESTGSKDVNSKEFVDAALNCGDHATGYGTGKNFEKDANNFKVKVLQGAKNGTEISFSGISNKDCYIDVSKPDAPKGNQTGGWIGDNVSDTINNSPIIDKLKYKACTSTAVEVSPQILKTDQRVCSYPEEDRTVTLIPDPAYFEKLSNTTKEYWTLIEEKDKKVGNQYSLSIMTISYDEEQHITNATLKWPAMVLGFRNAHGGNGTESTDILLPWLSEVTNMKIDPKDAKDLADASTRCGSHAGGDKNGKNYAKHFGNFTAVVGGGEDESKPRKHERSFRKDILGDCGVTVFIDSKKNDAPKKNSSASTWSKSSNAKMWATAGAVAAAIRFII
jgi:hypothetical protein